MRPALAGHPLANALFGFTLLIWMVLETRQALHRRAGATDEDRYSLILVRVLVAAGVLCAWLSLAVQQTSIGFNPLVVGIGLCLIWAGIALRWWSFKTLGTYFTFSVMTSADQPVITSGPYRFLRHPSYTGILLVLVGIGVCLGNLLSVAALLGFSLIGFLYRIRVEERALSSRLGPAYRDFAQNRKRLIPFVW